jgi:glycosyltransferase involved in cell wall biosynthesis
MSTAIISISIIIPNYNYDAFLGAAIDSALALDSENVEVIVVDDGSTDGSRAVIEQYGDRVVAIYQANAGQAMACEAGFKRSRGEIVIFLDSDDLLDPSIGRELARVWRAGVSKVQFQMKTIDGAGRDLGTVFPQFHICPSPIQILQWVLATSAYPTPPGSGNAYARQFLAQIFPLDGNSRIADAYFLAAAPFFGDVLTVPRPLVSYRVHGRNDGALTTLDVNRFGRDVARGKERFAYAQRMAAQAGFLLPAGAQARSLSMLPYRIASFRLAPDAHPVPHDRSRVLLKDMFRAVFSPQGTALQGRLTLLVWALAALTMPDALARRVILWRFAPTSRPAILRKLLTRLKVIR